MTSCTRDVVYVRRARVQGRTVLWCLCCVPFFRGRDAVCVTMSRHVFARTPSLRDSDTHLPVRCTISSRSGAIGSRAPCALPDAHWAGRAWCQVAQAGLGKPPLLWCGRATFLGSLSQARPVTRPTFSKVRHDREFSRLRRCGHLRAPLAAAVQHCDALHTSTCEVPDTLRRLIKANCSWMMRVPERTEVWTHPRPPGPPKEEYKKNTKDVGAVARYDQNPRFRRILGTSTE